MRNYGQDDEKHSVSKFVGVSDSYRKIAPYLNVGYVWATSVLLFTFLGIKLDEAWDKKPIFTVIGAVIGVTGGFYHFLKTVLKFSKKE